MPLNSAPAAVTGAHIAAKAALANAKAHVNVGFWGGLVPENAGDPSAIKARRVGGQKGRG